MCWHERYVVFRRVLCIVSIWVVVSLIFFPVAYAEPPYHHEMLDDMVKRFQDATGGWANILEVHAKRLFFLLASIELAWTGMMWVLQKNEMPEFITAIVRKVMWLSFFYMFLLNFDVWVPAIINSFSDMGSEVAGSVPGWSGGLSPSDVVVIGLEIQARILDITLNLGFFEKMLPALMVAFGGWFVLICFFVIALQLIVALVESYMVMSAGVLFLGLGGSRWTGDFAHKFLAYAVAVGVKLFMIYLVVSVGLGIARQWPGILEGGEYDVMRGFSIVAAGAFVFAGLTTMIPRLVSSMMGSVVFARG